MPCPPQRLQQPHCAALIHLTQRHLSHGGHSGDQLASDHRALLVVDFKAIRVRERVEGHQVDHKRVGVLGLRSVGGIGETHLDGTLLLPDLEFERSVSPTHEPPTKEVKSVSEAVGLARAVTLVSPQFFHEGVFLPERRGVGRDQQAAIFLDTQDSELHVFPGGADPVQLAGTTHTFLGAKAVEQTLRIEKLPGRNLVSRKGWIQHSHDLSLHLLVVRHGAGLTADKIEVPALLFFLAEVLFTAHTHREIAHPPIECVLHEGTSSQCRSTWPALPAREHGQVPCSFAHWRCPRVNRLFRHEPSQKLDCP
mmetsp:Transcript_10269/g.29657  ORF Transcript_10269/g.29657 Transcript_10269/m.29657 type:complete len:309 (-) Transcript_10269:747-1673(-)